MICCTFCQVDKATLVGETINFIKILEETKAQLEKKKIEQALLGLVPHWLWRES